MPFQKHTSALPKNTLRSLAAKEGRLVRPVLGHPAALRQNSSWAGTWTGVATFGDFACHPIDLWWPADIWESSRIQVSTHIVGNHNVLIANVYGYPRGPTWPRASSLTSDILKHLTSHLVIGYDGLAAIVGDFNHDPNELDEFSIWRSFGWKCPTAGTRSLEFTDFLHMQGIH